MAQASFEPKPTLPGQGLSTRKTDAMKISPFSSSFTTVHYSPWNESSLIFSCSGQLASVWPHTFVTHQAWPRCDLHTLLICNLPVTYYSHCYFVSRLCCASSLFIYYSSLYKDEKLKNGSIRNGMLYNLNLYCIPSIQRSVFHWVSWILYCILAFKVSRSFILHYDIRRRRRWYSSTFKSIQVMNERLTFWTQSDDVKIFNDGSIRVENCARRLYSANWLRFIL